MQAIDRIKDRTKPQVTRPILSSVSIREIAHPYQWPITNTCINNSFSCFFNSIMGTMILTIHHSDKKQAHLMEGSRYFSCKERGHTAYNCLRKGKIAAISKRVSEDNDS